MSIRARPYRVCIATLPHASAASVYCAHDDLASVGRLDRGFGLASSFEEAPFSVRTVGVTTEPMSGAAGIPICAQKAIDEVEDCDLVFVPALMPHPGWMDRCGEEPVFDERLKDWIRGVHAAGATIVSLCTGSFVLAEAGLLDGLPATTHWACAELLQRRFPAIDVQARRPIIVTGDGGRLIVAGTGTYHGDLILLLVQRFLGQEAAHSFARLSGKFWAAKDVDVYARLVERANVEDSLVRDAQHWLAEHLTVADPVRALARRFHQTDRTLHRRFQATTGKSPLAYLQSLRVERARQWLESTRIPVVEIADRVGYADSRHFTRVFRRETGFTPGAYRKRFRLAPAELVDAASIA